MKYALNDLPVAFAEAGIITREARLGELDASYEMLPAGLDLAPLFRGLPDDLCQCPHWGYLLRGQVRVKYKGEDELIRAGDCFYIPPGHLPIFEEDSEWIVFSPRGEHQKTAEVVRRNKAAFLPSEQLSMEKVDRSALLCAAEESIRIVGPEFRHDGPPKVAVPEVAMQHTRERVTPAQDQD